jgi:hypothetical protein
MSVAMDEQSRLRQFYLRCLLAVGILWGFLPLIMLPFVFRGANDSSLDVLAAVLNGFTILPASVLAFWHRRVACIWLTINAVFVVSRMDLSRVREYGAGSIIGVMGSVLLAILLDAAEARGWPGALEK